MFFSFERLLDSPAEIRMRLFYRLGLKGVAPPEVREGSGDSSDSPALDRLEVAQSLYQEMTARAGIALS